MRGMRPVNFNKMTNLKFGSRKTSTIKTEGFDKTPKEELIIEGTPQQTSYLKKHLAKEHPSTKGRMYVSGGNNSEAYKGSLAEHDDKMFRKNMVESKTGYTKKEFNKEFGHVKGQRKAELEKLKKDKETWYKVRDGKQTKINKPSDAQRESLLDEKYVVSKVTESGNKTNVHNYSPDTRLQNFEKRKEQENNIFERNEYIYDANTKEIKNEKEYEDRKKYRINALRQGINPETAKQMTRDEVLDYSPEGNREDKALTKYAISKHYITHYEKDNDKKLNKELKQKHTEYINKKVLGQDKNSVTQYFKTDKDITDTAKEIKKERTNPEYKKNKKTIPETEFFDRKQQKDILNKAKEIENKK